MTNIEKEKRKQIDEGIESSGKEQDQKPVTAVVYITIDTYIDKDCQYSESRCFSAGLVDVESYNSVMSKEPDWAEWANFKAWLCDDEDETTIEHDAEIIYTYYKNEFGTDEERKLAVFNKRLSEIKREYGNNVEAEK